MKEDDINEAETKAVGEESLMKKRFESSSELAGLMTFEEFKESFKEGLDENDSLLITNPQIIARIMASSCEDDALLYTPFIKTYKGKSYNVNYANGIIVSRSKLAE